MSRPETIDQTLVEKVHQETLLFYPALVGITEEEANIFVEFAKVWGPIMKEDPRFGISIENFLNATRRALPKPHCFGEDDCSTSMMINCKVAPICGK